MLADTTASTLHLLSDCRVGLWLGLLLFLAAAAFALWQLSRDVEGIKPTRITRWVLPTLRVVIVGLIVWLLCQPVLLIQRHWTPGARVMLVVDSGNSMRVNESAGDISRQLDALDAVGNQPIAKRNNAASRTARACDAIARVSVSAITVLQKDQDTASTGLPLGPAVGKTVETLAASLRAQADLLISSRAAMPVETQLPAGDKDLLKSLGDLTSASQLVGASVDGLIADGAVVGREASKSPHLLDAYPARLKKLAADANATRKLATDIQQHLDKTMLAGKEMEALRAKPLTRQALADMAADRLAGASTPGKESDAASNPARLAWDRQHSPAIAAALDDAFRSSLESPLAGVVILSDGSSPLPTAGSAARSALAGLKIPVSTVLIGADGEEPTDAGLIAIDVPRIALAGDAVTLRCLVKNRVTATPPPKLIVTAGKETVGMRDLSADKDGIDVVEFSWTPAAVGRVQLIFKIETNPPDAYPGNETSAAVVDVLNNKAHVLVVSDRLTGDFAAVSQLLAAMPGVDVHTLLAAPGLSKFHTGSKADEFPASADDYKAISMLVLIGDVPQAAGADVIDSLKKAIDAGLCVWVQSPAAGRSARSWASALGLDARPMEGPHALEPVKDLWLNLYQLGAELDESAARWKTLPPVAGLSEIIAPGVPLLNADGRAVLKLLPRKAGAVVVSGISDFTALRNSSTSSSVNRLLAESLALALVPIGEPGSTGGMFPSQPVQGRNVYLIGDAVAGKGLAAADSGVETLDGVKKFRVTDPQSISIQTGAVPRDLTVRLLYTRRDFELAAHAVPLQEIADETGGRYRDLLSMADVAPPGLTGTPHSSATRLPLWPGAWSLIALLALVSAEYLLRRKAGKVM